MPRVYAPSVATQPSHRPTARRGAHRRLLHKYAVSPRASVHADSWTAGTVATPSPTATARISHAHAAAACSRRISVPRLAVSSAGHQVRCRSCEAMIGGRSRLAPLTTCQSTDPSLPPSLPRSPDPRDARHREKRATMTASATRRIPKCVVKPRADAIGNVESAGSTVSR